MKGTLPGKPQKRLPPYNATQIEDITLSRLLYDTLYRESGQAPWLASALPQRLEKNRYLIKIPTGILWHNGITMTSKDVARSLRLAKKGPNAWMLADVIVEGETSQGVILQSVLSASELAKTLSYPQLAIANLSRGVPTGTGPFRLASLNHHRVVLRSHINHFKGSPFIQKLTLRWYPSAREEAATYEIGAIDLSSSGKAAFSGRKPKYPTTQTTVRKRLVALMPCKASFWSKHAEARKILWLTINHRALLKAGLKGDVRSQTVIPNQPPNVAAAKSRLAKMPRIPTTPQKIYFENDHHWETKVAKVIQSSLSEVGISTLLTHQNNCDLKVMTIDVSQDMPPAVRQLSKDDSRWVLLNRKSSPYQARRSFQKRLPSLPLLEVTETLWHRDTIYWYQGKTNLENAYWGTQ